MSPVSDCVRVHIQRRDPTQFSLYVRWPNSQQSSIVVLSEQRLHQRVGVVCEFTPVVTLPFFDDVLD
jgi:hypothetical protein